MDWLMYIIMIILFAAVLVLLWKNYRIKKEAKLFAEKVEDALDAIVTGKEWNMEEELEDSLWARGDFRENSDIDIMILVKMSDEEIRLVKNDIYDLAFEFEINTGIEFSPIIKNEDQYEYWIDTLPFYRNVRDEGVVIDE